MTNAPSYPLGPHQHVLPDFLAEHGISELHGVEVMRLIHLLANSYETVTSGRASNDKLSGPRWHLILHLWTAERMGMPWVGPTQLSKTQQVSKNTISTHLRSLEEQGLIERELDPEDRRQFRIRLSESGRALVQSATPSRVRFLNSLTADLSKQEIEQLTALFRRLLRSVVRQGGFEDRCRLMHDP